MLRPLLRIRERAGPLDLTNAALGLLAIAVAAVYWLLIPYAVQLEHAAMGITGRFFPRMAAFIVGISGALLFLRALVVGKRRSEQSEPEETNAPLDPKALRRVAPYLIVTIAYVALIDIAGYLTTTVLALAFLLWLAGERRIWLVVLTAVVVSAGLYILFQYVMQVPLPAGAIL